MEPFIALALGLAIAFVPGMIWIRKVSTFTPLEYVEQYPKRKLFYMFLHNLPFIWILFYLFVVLLVVTIWPGLTDLTKATISTFWIGAGIGLLYGIVEVFTCTSVLHRGRIIRIMQDPKLRAWGALRLCVIGLLTLIGALIVL